ncbi:MAG: hypothetical protein KC475_09800 [Cyanobacteria bacterium HKST-UBA03]|nr:hypothetical protein [Cyanobacteria bacterium HKST-UBA03]
MTLDNYILLCRKIRQHWTWPDVGQVHTEGEALVDLIMEVAHTPHKQPFNGETVFVERGELVTSYRALAKRWGWSKDKVSRFIARLEREGTVRATKRASKRATLKLTNYAALQGKSEGQRATKRASKRATPSATAQSGQVFSGPINNGKSNGKSKRSIDGSCDNSRGGEVIQQGLALLVGSGKSEDAACQELGRWVDRFGDDAVASAIEKTRKASPRKPAAYMQQLLSKGEAGSLSTARSPEPLWNRRPTGPSHGDLGKTNPYECAKTCERCRVKLRATEGITIEEESA